MKTIVSTLALFLISLTPLSAQWEIINDGSDLKGWLSTIDFVNENIGWIGMSAGVLMTNDGGENWDIIYEDDNMNISQIDFINELTGWAIGYKYIEPSTHTCVWKTLDGGQSWSRQLALVFDSFAFSSVFAIDSIKAFVVGGNRIYKTSNGGSNWVNIALNLPNRNYNSVWFWDSQNGVVAGSYNDGVNDRAVILKTTNGGTTWTETIVNELNYISELQFIDPSNGYFRARKDTTNYICKTEDIFLTWGVITQSPYWISSYQYLDNNTAYAIMDDSISHNVKKSLDGGYNWHTIQSIKYGDLHKIYISKKNYSFILGYFSGAPFAASPVLLKKVNTDEWIIQKFTVPLKDVCFWDKSKGIYIGDYRGWHSSGSIIFSTTNGGITTDVSFGTGGSMNSCFILDENVACALADWGNRIYKTYDFGVNWHTVFLNNTDSLSYEFFGCDISFINEQNGFTAGRYQDSTGAGAGILYSTDGGDSWELGWKFPNTSSYEYNLSSIYLKNNIGWSVGESGMILKYTPQASWVKQTSVTDLPLNKVFFSDDNHVWIAGGYHNENGFYPILLKTTNGGADWTAVPNISYLFRDIVFIDNNLGWAIGYDSSGIGGILETIDGGITWSIDTGNLPAQLNALHIKDNYGWAVGDNGLILRTTDAGAVWVEDENNNSLPTEFVLEQNYPNPFNPSTIISWQSPVGSRQTIKIFDVLGREIETLVDEYKEAGSHSKLYIVKSTLPSGIYFYQLRADEFVSTKKMILLK